MNPSCVAQGENPADWPSGLDDVKTVDRQAELVWPASVSNILNSDWSLRVAVQYTKRYTSRGLSLFVQYTKDDMPTPVYGPSWRDVTSG